MRKNIVMVLFALSVLTTSVHCGGHKEPPIYVVATDPTYQPMEFLDDAGELTGFDICSDHYSGSEIQG